MSKHWRVVGATTVFEVGAVVKDSELPAGSRGHLLNLGVIVPADSSAPPADSAPDPAVAVIYATDSFTADDAEGRIRSTLRGLDGLKVEVVANDGREWVIQVASAHGWKLLDVAPAEVKAEGSEPDKAPSPDEVKASVTPELEKTAPPAAVDLTIPIKGGGKITRVQVGESKFRYKVWHGELDGADLDNLKAEQVAPIAEALGVAAEKKAIRQMVDAEAPGE